MSTSNTITKTDLQNIINAIFPATTEDMTQAQVDAFVASLNVAGVDAVDYIVEQGSNSNGIYRKWDSGILEQWGHTTIGSNSAATWYYPISFIDTDVEMVASCHYLSNGTYVAPTISVQPIYTNYANLYARVSTSTVSQAHKVSCYAIGRWK